MNSLPVISNIVKNYKDTQNAFLPKTVTVPLFQERNIDCVSIVKIGDTVKEGDIIAISQNFDEKINIHSPIPGKVIDILPCICSNGQQKFAIKIQLQGSFSHLGKRIKVEQNLPDTVSKLSEHLIEKGVLNTFKISEPVNLGLQLLQLKKDSNLVLRMYDEDPFRITDSLISKFFTEEVMIGAQIISNVLNCKGVLLALDQKFSEKNKIDLKKYTNFKILEMMLKKYPSGTPREIISGFNRRIKSTSNFKVSKTDLFIDSSTAYEVYKAVICNTPSIERYVHISGNCINTSCLLNVKIGTNVSDIVNSLGGFIKSPRQVIINGQIVGNAVNSLNFPITKNTKSIMFISTRNFTDNQLYSCINCGNCRFNCHAKLSPDIIYNYVINFQEINNELKKTVLACIDCGQCNTVCPARLPLAQTIDILRKQILAEEVSENA